MISQALMLKIGVYLVLSLGLLWIGKQWLNAHDNKVAQQTREEVTEQQRIQAEAKFKAEREALLIEKKNLSDRMAELELQNTKLYGSLNESIKLSKKLQDANAGTVINIPDSELNGAIRAVLAGQQPSQTR